MSRTRKIVTQKLIESASSYTGKQGDLFYDTIDGVLKISDGQTVGGIAIGGGNSNSNSNSSVGQFLWTDPQQNPWGTYVYSNGFAGEWDGSTPLTWLDLTAAIPAGAIGVIVGATIDYHAYIQGGGTASGSQIGTITFISDSGAPEATANVLYSPAGNTGGSFANASGKTLQFIGQNGAGTPILIQYVAKVFTSVEYYC